jgi:hypothetical protein
MRGALFHAGLLVAVFSAVPAFAQAPLGPVLEIGARVYTSDGQQTTSAVKGDPSKIETYIWASRDFCRLGSAATLERIDTQNSPIVWHVVAKSVGQAAGRVLAEIAWQRVSEPYKAGSLRPAETVTLAGDIPLLLDKAVTAGTRSCGAEARLEASVAFRPSQRSGGAQVVTSKQDGQSIQADVWLVHTDGGGAERATAVSLRSGAAGAAFSFAPVSLETRAGTVNVEVAGFIRPVKINAEGVTVAIALYRRIVAPQNPAVDVSGSTSKELTLLTPNAVTALEIPAVQGTIGTLVAGHKFSVRVRARIVE